MYQRDKLTTWCICAACCFAFSAHAMELGESKKERKCSLVEARKGNYAG